MHAINDLNIKDFAHYLKSRSKECHKGNFGKVLIIGGNIGYSGAVRLAGEAALRVGAGCVVIATHKDHAMCLNLSCPELMCHGVGLNDAKFKQLLEQATFIILGPGLGTTDWSLSLLKTTLEQEDTPMLLDADALNLIAADHIAMKRSNCIYTPHPGEAARLLNVTADHIQQNRVTAINQLYELLAGVIVLKGAGTLILSDNSNISICSAGNPGMATAGMGDVLSGIIAGFAAQNIPLSDAAKLGVVVHALAGDLAAQSNGERGMIASDLIANLRSLVN